VLRLLTDGNISHVVAREVARHQPECDIISLHEWQGGMYLHASDAVILSEAHRNRLTLVTRDIRSIGPLLRIWYSEGRAHFGVIFVDERTISEGNVGAFVDALIRYWREERDTDWENRTAYLPR
jgi:hypothetical protein